MTDASFAERFAREGPAPTIGPVRSGWRDVAAEQGDPDLGSFRAIAAIAPRAASNS
jgi:hypothetical protein